MAEKETLHAKKEQFLDYYNQELAYLRIVGTELGKNRTEAARLRMDIDHCDDPHVERLLEGFAFLAARIHVRLDDEFPEITGALLEELYPDLTRPIPPIALVQIEMDRERGDLGKHRRIPRGATVIASSPGGISKFQTCFDTDVWPIQVVGASVRTGPEIPERLTRGRKTSAGLRIDFATLGDIELAAVDIDRLRLHFSGRPYLVDTLYQLLLSQDSLKAANCCHTVAICSTADDSLAEARDASCLEPVGFDNLAEALCPNPAVPEVSHPVAPQFSGFRILEDYFVFPAKFHFFDVTGIPKTISRLPGRNFSLWFLLSPIDDQRQQTALEEVTPTTFRLGCTPIVNLFEQKSGPIRVQQRVYQERIPVESGNEIYSVNSITAGSQAFGRLIGGGALATDPRRDGYFTVSRQDSLIPGRSPEYLVSLVGRDGAPLDPGARVLTAGLTCTNRERLALSRIANGSERLQIRNSPELRIICIRNQTDGLPAPPRRKYLWRLLSQLSLNHLSLVEGGLEALQTILRIHDLAEVGQVNKQIAGMNRIASEPTFGRVRSQHGISFVRGKSVTMTFNESTFADGGAFLFSAILDRFLASYTSLNSFSQLTVNAGAGKVFRWPPRSGNKIVG